MTRSMTGYGRAESVTDTRRIGVELKSVNNRYADFNIRMPRKFLYLESRIRFLLKNSISRGKVDVFITTEDYGEAAGALHVNKALAGSYVEHMRELIAEYGMAGEVSISDIVRAPEVFVVGDAEADEEEMWNQIRPVVEEAIRQFNAAREEEGVNLRTNILEKLNELEEVTDAVILHEPEIMAAYKEKLTAKLTEILSDSMLDESRVAAECVVYADRICTDEETVRLKSHIEQMRREFDKNESIGRKLDFLAQEMNREANTTLSKAGDLLTADYGITMKTTIEKIREQIQNIE